MLACVSHYFDCIFQWFKKTTGSKLTGNLLGISPLLSVVTFDFQDFVISTDHDNHYSFAFRIFLCSIMDLTGSDDALSQKGQQVGLEPAIISELLSAGWIADSFAHVVSSADGFDSVWSELFPLQDLSLLQKSGIRALRSKLREAPAASSDASGSKPDSSQSADSSWSDIFPPKLSSSVISNLKQSFLASYPSEMLTNETCPSTRLLSLVYHHVKKKDVRWVPWKYRMSISKADDHAGCHSTSAQGS